MPFSSVDKRELLVRPWSLAMMVVAVLAVMALLLPRNSLISSLERIGSPDALSVAYLQTLLRAELDNDEIRLLLVDHLAATGRVDEAERELRKVREGRAISRERMAYLRAKMAVARLALHPRDAEIRRQAEAAVRAMLEFPAKLFSIQQWRMLASALLQSGLPHLAAECYLRLAALNENHQIQWLREAVRWYVASGQNGRAGSVQLQLFEKTRDVADAKRAFAYLLAANRADQVVREMDVVIRQFPEDEELLQTGLQAAMMLHSYATARRWLEAWLQSHERDTAMIQRLIELEMAAGRPRAAYAWARRLVELEPENIAYHEQLARVAEWSGHSQEAFAQWQWLIEHRREAGDIDKAMELANALHDYEAVDRLLALHASMYRLTQPESSMLARVKEKLGEPELSEKARVAYLKKSPNDRAAWEELAMLREYLGKLDESAATWREIERRFGRSEQSVINRARMEAMTGEPEKGLRMMRDYAATRHPESERYWKVYGDIAWDLEYHDDAVAAYRWLWDHESEASHEAQRLMILMREEGNYEGILEVSRKSWQRFHDPDLLLLAIESAVEIGKWKDVERLMHDAEAELEYFWDRPRYWLAHARWMLYEDRIDVAEHDYLVALRFSPQDEEARIGLLWVYIQSDQRRKLGRCLTLWQADAAGREPYWQPYAAGYRRMGRARQSLPWFRKTMRQHPDDLLWMLEYADALDASGQASGAWRLRRHLFTRLWPGSRMHGDYLKKNGAAASEAMLRLKQDIEGTPAAAAWSERLLAESDDPVLREFAIRWYFGIGRHSRSSWWLLRQHARRVETERWQQLALAMERNDQEAIDRIISRSPGTDHFSKMYAYRQLEQLDNAWLLAMDSGIGAGHFSAIERTTMFRQARDIGALSPNALHAGVAFDHFGPLNLRALGLKGFYSRNNLTTSLKMNMTDLQYAPAFANAAGVGREYELQLAGRLHLRRTEWLAYIGSNQRRGGIPDGGGLLQWGGALRYSPWQNGELGVSLAVNDTGLETPAFRLVGARDRLRFHLTSDITSREYFTAGFNINRYSSRPGVALASGESLDAQIGHRLQLSNSLAEERMLLYLRGEWLRNRLQPSPGGYALTILPGASVASIVPASYGALGVGFNLQRDNPGNDEAISRLPAYLFDGWVGWQWPGSTLAYNLNFGLGAPLLGRDMLSLKFYLANSMAGGIGNDSLYGVALWYSYRLGR